MTRLRQHVLLFLLAALPAGAFASTDHWIFEADVVLFDDFDSDGYNRFLSVRIDADTLRASALVYAELYLSDDGVNWQHYHTTEDFTIGGETYEDELFVETELLSGFPPGEYDLLIELYDAEFGTYCAEYGPNQDPAMALLALEDATYDPSPVQITVLEGGGGAFSWLLLPGLLLVGWRARRAAGGARRPDAPAGKPRMRRSSPSS